MVAVCTFINSKIFHSCQKTFWSWFKSYFYQHFWKIVTNIRHFYDLIIDCSERQSTELLLHLRGHSSTTWTKFYLILTTYSLWVENMDILHTIYTLSRVHSELSTDHLPTPSCPRSYWMPPYRVWVLKGNWVPPAFEGISFYQIHDSSPISFYFRSLASLSLSFTFSIPCSIKDRWVAVSYYLGLRMK